MNYYRRHLGDYAKDTGFLTTYQHGVYALLLDWYYANEKAIPLAIVYRIVRARTGPEKASVDEVVSIFFDVSNAPGFAHSKRADLDISKYKFKSEANSLIALERECTKRARIVASLVVGSCESGEPSHKPLANSHKEQEQEQDQKLGEPTVPKVAAKKIQLNLPDWLPPSAWQDWHNFRNASKGWTHRARELSIAKLGRLREAGNDPVEVIEQSIECGWRGLFGLGNDRSITSQTGPTSKAGQAIQLLEAMKNEQRRSDSSGDATPALLGFGGDASGGTIRGDRPRVA